MSAPWYPPCTAIRSAVSATTVFPEPTSPWRSRCIGAGRRHVGAISSIGPPLVAGERERQAPRGTPATSGPSTSCRCPAAPPRARACGPPAPPACGGTRRTSSRSQARRAAPDRARAGGSTRYALRRGRRGRARRGSPPSSGSASPRASAASQRLGHELADLPGEHLGLARLRVHRHDDARCLSASLGPGRARRPPGSSSGACPR